MKKSEREDFDELYKSLQTFKADQDKRLLSTEKEFDKLAQEIGREVESMKQSFVGGLSKKADFTLLERLRENNNKKVDFEQF